MTYRYVPLLRTKAGEVTALHNLTAAAKQRISPIVHVVAAPPATFVTKLSAAWANEIALDGLFNFGVTGSTSVFADMLRDLRQAGVTAIPSVEVNADSRYVAAAKKFIITRQPNLVVKVAIAQLPVLQAWVTAQGWKPKNVDLVITAGHVAEYGDGQFAGYVGHAINNGLTTPAAWRSVTLASAAAPKDTGSLQVGMNQVPRLDWALWQKVRTQVGFQLDYGDYGIAHPDLTDPPGVAMTKATVSVRYTIDNAWLVIKGRPTTGASGQPMANQYRQHARTLHAHQQFDKLQGCWADGRITAIATTPTKSGSRTTWVEICANRHLMFIADRLP